MPKKERLQFDFTGASGGSDIDKLEDILCAGHWSPSGLITGLVYESEPTLLLLKLLQVGGIELYKHTYVTQDDISPEVRRRAVEFNARMRKREIGYPLLDIVAIFFDQEFDGSKTVFNSLFFPALNAFVRCGSLAPDRLIDMLERDGCNKVLLFPSARYDENYYHEFIRAMPRDAFIDELEAMRDRTVSAMGEAIQRAEDGVEFPTLPDLEFVDEG